MSLKSQTRAMAKTSISISINPKYITNLYGGLRSIYLAAVNSFDAGPNTYYRACVYLSRPEEVHGSYGHNSAEHHGSPIEVLRVYRDSNGPRHEDNEEYAEYDPQDVQRETGAAE